MWTWWVRRSNKAPVSRSLPSTSVHSSNGRLLVTSNPPFDEWAEVLGSERLTGALLDRLTHHVHILVVNGESYRLAQSKKRQRSSRTPVSPPPS